MRELILMLASILFCSSAWADQVVLKNGDRLTGSIVKADAKTITIKSEFAGTVLIPLEAVVQITSDQLLFLNLKDGQTVVGTVVTKDANLEVKTADTGTVSVARQSIAAINSKETQAAYQLAIDRLRNPRLIDLWSGSAELGLALARGNSETATFNLGFQAARTTPRDKISVYATSLYARNSTTGTSITTANAKRGGARYDLNLSSKVFGFGTGDLESDEFQKLDLRVVLGGGMGWHARSTERVTMDFFGGGSLNKEYFSTGLNRTSGEALVGQEFVYRFSSRTSFRERAVFFPNVSQSGQYRLNFDASATTLLKTWLGWQLTFSDRYLSDPVGGAKPNDILLSTGLRLTFGR
jgi:putative salt-induced outer membrane protein YdiY